MTTEERKPLYGVKIERSALLELTSGMGDISTHSLGQWLKSKTNDEYVVVPRKSLKHIDNYAFQLKIASHEISYVMENEIENCL